MKRIGCCEGVLLSLSILFFLLGLLGLFLFPSIYQTIVYQLMLLRDDKTGEPGYSTWLFSKPPMRNEMAFYFFNITNEFEMIYEGAAPRVVEVGPYTFLESEDKRYLDFKDDDTKIFYQNFKKWVYSDELSCEGCDYYDIITVPNSPQVGCAAGMVDPDYHVPDVTRFLISVGLLILGENAVNSPTVGELLFDGYNDPLLSAAHSPFVALISDLFNGGESVIPIPVPDMHTMAFFNGYNNTKDEEYWVYTGKGDLTRIGTIVSWANLTELPHSWWPTKQARMINGSDTGSFASPGLTPDSVLPMFHSYMCRSFNAEYVGKKEVSGIPCYTFSVPSSEWDTTLERNKGFRYRNVERVNYYPDWPTCPHYNASNCDLFSNVDIDCSMADNFCADCCQKSKVDGTYVLPPGMFPLVCYPGRLLPSPFAVVWTPPHFIYSPKEVIDSVKGLSPIVGRHEPMVYDHEPYSGMITKVAYRVQVAIPMFANDHVTQNKHLPNSIVPIFWEDSNITLADFAYNYFWLGFVFAPQFIEGFSFGLIALAIILLAIFAFLRIRRK